jgi:deazaflavin-dependent oxidoreductase (nitroreductase family)
MTSKLFSAAGRLMSKPSMRPLTRAFSDLHARLYRATGGAVQTRRYPTMLLTVTGRRTGAPRTVPLIYIRDGVHLVIAAAYAGSDSDPEWWLNLRANPLAVAQINGEHFAVEARLARDAARDELWRRLVEMYPYFTDYQQRTARVIPVVTLTPTESFGPTSAH